MMTRTKLNMNSRHVDTSKAGAFFEQHSPFLPPRITVWHILIVALFVIFFVVWLKAPGLLADLGGSTAFYWQAGMRIRIAFILLSIYAMVGIRGMHPLMYVGLMFMTTAASFKGGVIRISHDPLDWIGVCWLVGASIVAVRVITRAPDPKPVAVKVEE